MQGIDDATERHRHAERQLGAMQESIEELILTKADKGDIATASKLKAGLVDIQEKAANAVKVKFRPCDGASSLSLMICVFGTCKLL